MRVWEIFLNSEEFVAHARSTSRNRPSPFGEASVTQTFSKTRANFSTSPGVKRRALKQITNRHDHARSSADSKRPGRPQGNVAASPAPDLDSPQPRGNYEVAAFAERRFGIRVDVFREAARAAFQSAGGSNLPLSEKRFYYDANLYPGKEFVLTEHPSFELWR